jgi:hypothetical protein
MPDPRLAPSIEYFDRAAMPSEIAEWPEIDPETARLIR